MIAHSRKHEIVIIDHDEEELPPPRSSSSKKSSANNPIVLDHDDDDEPNSAVVSSSSSSSKNTSRKSKKKVREDIDDDGSPTQSSSSASSSSSSSKNGRRKSKKAREDTKEIDEEYTSSKSLVDATLDIRAQGLMTVSNVFSSVILQNLMHGPLSVESKSKRVIHKWDGVFKEFKKHMTFDDRSGKVKTTDSQVVHRGGRFDLKMPTWVVDKLHLADILESLLRVLREIMDVEPQIRTHNVVFVPKNSHEDQAWHLDDVENKKNSKHKYFTILIHLNPIDERCGGTEYVNAKGEAIIVRAKPGDAFVFHGALEHRGLGNRGDKDRFFYYASFSCHPDENDL